MLIENTDQRSQDYSAGLKTFSVRAMPIANLRTKKYGLRAIIAAVDVLPRETAMRVAAGRLPKKYPPRIPGIETAYCLTQMGDIPLEIKDWSLVEQNPFSAGPG